MSNINPDHYKNQTSLECIEAMEIVFGTEAVMHFCVLNAFKYIWRWKNKNGDEDLHKALWYLNRADSTDYVDNLNDIIMGMRSYIGDQGVKE